MKGGQARMEDAHVCRRCRHFTPVTTSADEARGGGVGAKKMVVVAACRQCYDPKTQEAVDRLAPEFTRTA